MPDLRLEKHDKPSYFNKELLVGLVLALAVPVGGVAMVATIATGTLIGSYLGKRRMSDEYVNGKLIEEPTAWNKDAVIGSGIAAVLGMVAGGLATGVYTLVTGTPMPQLATFQLITAASAAAGGILGAIAGGYHGKADMQLETDKVIKQQVARQLGKSVTPEISQAVEYSQQQGKGWVKEVLAERQLEQQRGGIV